MPKSCTQTAEWSPIADLKRRLPMRTTAPGSVMNIVLINPPHTAIGSRVPDDHLPPLGLLSIGGPLIDAGHDVRLIDADRTNMPLQSIIAAALSQGPAAVLIGHSGSTSVHPTALGIMRGL